MTSGMQSEAAGSDHQRPPTFIVGMPRTGSKIYKNLINDNTDINISAEIFFLTPPWIREDVARKTAREIGSLEDAEMHYRRATELAPSNGAAANAYAAFLCSRQNRWADAEAYFPRAAADSTYLTPEVALTNAGVCARDAGQAEAAVDGD